MVVSTTILFFSFGLILGVWKFRGQELSPSCRCSNARSFNLLCWTGERTSADSQATAVGFLTYCNIAATPLIPFFFFFFGLLSYLGPHPKHMEVPRLGVESEEVYLLTYARATTMPDLSHICDPHHSSWQCWIPSPLSKARDRTQIPMDTSWVH